MRQTVIVTGAAKGLGKAIATAYAKKEHQVVLADVDTANGEKHALNLRDEGFDVVFVQCDVSEPNDIGELVKISVERFSRIDVIINNAGISEFTPPLELDVDGWDRVLNTNLRSSFLLSRAALPVMKKNGGGAIVNIASTRALMSEPNSEAYAASKGGLLALTHAMAISFADSGVRVNCISPGWMHTGDYDKLRDIDHEQHPSRRVGKPEDIARACLFLTDPENDFINGENLVIDGGMTRKMIYEY